LWIPSFQPHLPLEQHDLFGQQGFGGQHTGGGGQHIIFGGQIIIFGGQYFILGGQHGFGQHEVCRQLPHIFCSDFRF